jgi:hypothetical protein
MKITETLLALRNPFGSDRIEWRLQSCGKKSDGTIWGKCLAYIDNRAAMERLDEVFGESWNQHESFTSIGSAAVCTVEITIAGENPRTVTGSCAVEANGDIDQFKSAASGAMKRAVVNLGIGRYLYDLPEAWAEISAQGQYTGKTKDGTWFKWNPPTLPSWALPTGQTVTTYAPQSEEPKDEVSPVKSIEQVLDTSKVKWKETPPPASMSATGDPWSVVVHFGKNKGTALRDLSEKSLSWYRDEWTPEPYKGKMSQDNLTLRAALDKIKGSDEPLPAPVTATEDDGDNVPF